LRVRSGETNSSWAALQTSSSQHWAGPLRGASLATAKEEPSARMIEIKNKTTGHVLLQVAADTLKGSLGVLYGADMEGGDLSGMDLSGADMSGAILEDANLDRANLTGACLLAAHLDRATLRCANLTNANLREAVLSGADLSGTDLADARYDLLT